MFVILKQSIDTVKVETDVSIHNQEDVIGMETDEFCEPQEYEFEFCEPQEFEPEVSHILGWVLWWWFLLCIFVFGFAHMELLKLVDLYGALHLLQC